MPNPAFMPVIGSGFDADAAQQSGWAGFNNQVDRQNLDSYGNAVGQQNAYFRDVADMNRQDAQRAQSEQEQNASRQQDAYQFAQKSQQDQADQQQYLALEKAKIAAAITEHTYETGRQQAITSAQNDMAAVADLATKGHFKSRAEIAEALPNATKVQIDDLWETNDTAHKQLDQQFQFASGLADTENKKAVATGIVNRGDAPASVAPTNEWWNPAQWLGVGALARAAGSSPMFGAAPAPNTSWFDSMKNRAQDLTQQTAPFDSAKGGIGQFGITLNPGTGKYTPLTTPGWVPPGGAMRSAGNNFSSRDDVKAAYKAGTLTRDQAAQILQSQFGMD